MIGADFAFPFPTTPYSLGPVLFRNHIFRVGSIEREYLLFILQDPTRTRFPHYVER